MEEYAVSSLIEPELLLEGMCKAFDLHDVPITQEMIDRCFGQVAGELSDLELELQEFGEMITGFFERPLHIRSLAVYLQAGPQIRCEDYVLRFPKIIARYRSKWLL